MAQDANFPQAGVSNASPKSHGLANSVPHQQIQCPRMCKYAGSRLAHFVGMRGLTTALPKEYVFLFGNDLGFRWRKRRRLGWSGFAFLGSFTIHNSHDSGGVWIQRGIRIDNGEFPGVYCFICVIIHPLIHSCTHLSSCSSNFQSFTHPISLYFQPPNHPLIHPSTHPPIHPSFTIHPSHHPSLHPSTLH